MQEAQHTPGPWQAVPTKMKKGTIWHIACPTHVVAYTAGDNEPLAKLVAASPELVDALIYLVNAHEHPAAISRHRPGVLDLTCPRNLVQGL